MLSTGGLAVDAVAAAVVAMEDSPLFNAGIGSVFTSEGTHELDASIMEGKSGNCGAVAGVRTIKNPILAAKKVMEESDHVFFIGEGAEEFAKSTDLVIVDSSFFSTPHRLEQLKRIQSSSPSTSALDHSVSVTSLPQGCEEKKFGTVGAVAVDQFGHLAAATSTGGMTNKRCGRVGDSPVIGAGCYASDSSCAVSCTGTGETFIQAVAAYDVAARMKYGGQTLDQAARGALDRVVELGGEGGLIAVDARGSFASPFSSEGMYRGYARVGEPPVALIYDS